MKENIKTITSLPTSAIIAIFFTLVYFIVAFTETPEIFRIVFSVVLVIKTIIGFCLFLTVEGAKSVKIRKQMH